MMQTFDALDYLRLEVEVPPVASGVYVNLIRNGSGEQGGYGWITTQEGVVERGIGPTVRYTPIEGGVAGRFSTETYPVTPGQYVTASWVLQGTGTNYLLAFVDWIDSEGQPFSSINDSTYESGTTSTPTTVGPFLVPAEAYGARVRFAVYGAAGPVVPTASPVAVRSVKMICLPTDDEIAPAQIIDTSYQQILSSTAYLSIVRASLNLGTLSATILDTALDPATAETIRAGRIVRLTTTPSALTPTPVVLYTGRVADFDATYDPERTDTKACRIDLTAVDAAATLANVPRPNGVATLDGLRDVLEGCRVPWLINDSTAQSVAVPVVSRNENASALDQVAITRDSQAAFAYVDRTGRLVAFDTAHWPAIGDDIDEDVYSDLAVGLSGCINTVRINWLRYNPNTGETEEITYGPYVDRASADEWGASEATFTLHGTSEETFDLPAFAASVLASNGERVVRATSATIPITTPAKILAWGTAELYSRHQVTNTARDLEQTSHIASIEHTISPDRWLLKVGFDDPNQVATPQATPSPSAGGEAFTLGQLLRPVGEVTMWFGASEDVPTGWLRCDGSTFDDETYPALAEMLGSSTLPNLVDRFPIGAGVKDLGTSGGSPTSVITQDRAFNTATTGGGQVRVELVESPLDIMPPWRAIHFIIRAR
ncbi:MAG: tail fiber protein [Nocardioides sp.]|uniref:tail fiber protein n=1 Tax=Nocardioides sp. TaxID=35761 RepID=UPI00238AB5F2|nr:tail fiber protein [Nocardioides sp.]MDE0778367.1 tail fiber protein [Nocardioides sp.]